VDIRDPTVWDIAKQRIAACKAKGFLGVDPDNTDGYAVDSGFPVTAADTLSFLTMLSNETRALGMGIGLKNSLDLIEGNEALWDYAVNEQCYQFNECDKYAPFKTGECMVLP
jgi:hypothetical protein